MSSDGEKRKRKRREAFNTAKHDKPIERLPREKQKTPHSLLRVFEAARLTFDPKKKLLRPAFVDKLVIAWKKAGRAAAWRDSEGRYGEKITKQIFDATEAGTDKLFYWQIEAYSHVLEIPSGVILLTSRLTAAKVHEREQPTDNAGQPVTDASDAENVVRGLRAFLDHYEGVTAKLDKISDQAIKDLFNAYFTAANGADATEQ